MVVEKIEGVTITHFDLFKLLKGLEKERPGIHKRISEFIRDDNDIRFRPINGRILNINLYFYGIGDEYPTKALKEYPKTLEDSKLSHPEAFYDEYLDPEVKELRLDLNLILSVYEKDIDDIEAFPVMIKW